MNKKRNLTIIFHKSNKFISKQEFAIPLQFKSQTISLCLLPALDYYILKILVSLCHTTFAI